MAISRMQQPRQMYGLGSLVKSVTKGVKSAVSGVKDLVKSDVGKALGIAALGSYGLGMGPLGGFKGAGFLKNIPGIISGGIDKLGLKPGPDGPTFGQFATVFGLGSLGGAALEALTASGASEEELQDIRDVDSLRSYLRKGYEQLNPGASPMQVDRFVEANTTEYRANGGRIGYQDGTDFEKYLKGKEEFDRKQNAEQLYKEFLENKRRQKVAEQKTMAANGGRIGYAMGTDELVNQASGIMGLPQRTNKAGVKELDLRESGGFIPPVGVKEKADDIPAMLSNNEFVFTADAVRGMGNGNVNKGAQRMYDMMKKLEKGGRV